MEKKITETKEIISDYLLRLYLQSWKMKYIQKKIVQAIKSKTKKANIYKQIIDKKIQYYIFAIIKIHKIFFL